MTRYDSGGMYIAFEILIQWHNELNYLNSLPASKWALRYHTCTSGIRWYAHLSTADCAIYLPLTLELIPSTHLIYTKIVLHPFVHEDMPGQHSGKQEDFH